MVGMMPDASIVGSRFLRGLLNLMLIFGTGGLLGSQADAAPPLVVETWNIRYDNPGDGVHAWPHRRDGVITHLRDSKADIIGLQEVLPHQLAAITSGLEGHGCFSRGRERDEARGEAVPIRSDDLSFTYCRFIILNTLRISVFVIYSLMYSLMYFLSIP